MRVISYFYYDPSSTSLKDKDFALCRLCPKLENGLREFASTRSMADVEDVRTAGQLHVAPYY